MLLYATLLLNTYLHDVILPKHQPRTCKCAPWTVGNASFWLSDRQRQAAGSQCAVPALAASGPVPEGDALDGWCYCDTSGPHFEYRLTTGITTCDGGDNFDPGDVFGAGKDQWCPLLPPEWDDARVISECSKVCDNETACLGWVFYFQEAGNPKECCFRTGSTASKPPCPSCTARCYEKVGPGDKSSWCGPKPMEPTQIMLLYVNQTTLAVAFMTNVTASGQARGAAAPIAQLRRDGGVEETAAAAATTMLRGFSTAYRGGRVYHHVLLPGLEEGGQYSYRVAGGAAGAPWSPWHRITPVPPDGPTKIAWYGDSLPIGASSPRLARLTLLLLSRPSPHIGTVNMAGAWLSNKSSYAKPGAECADCSSSPGCERSLAPAHSDACGPHDGTAACRRP